MGRRLSCRADRPKVVLDWDEQAGAYKDTSEFRFLNSTRWTISLQGNSITDGSHWEFRGFRPGTHAKGLLHYRSTWGSGHTTEVTGYTGAGHISGIVTTFDGVTTSFSETYAYSYQDCPDGGERLASLSVTREKEGEAAQNRRRITYSYHDRLRKRRSRLRQDNLNPRASGTAHGYTGDLETAIHEIHETTASG